MRKIKQKISIALGILIPSIYIFTVTALAQDISEIAEEQFNEAANDYIEEKSGGIVTGVFGGSFEVDSEYLENQSGIVGEALNVLNTIFDIDIERGRFRLRNLNTILADLEIEDDCTTIFHIVPGVCPDGTEGIELPEAVEIEDDGDVRGSGKLRRNSEPQLDIFSSNKTVLERDLANLYDQQTSRAIAFDYLDETGEEWLLGNAAENQALLEGSNIIQEDITKLAIDAQNLEVTQDVMKNMAGMNQLSSQIEINNGILLGRINTSLLNIQQQTASSLLLSANISEAIDEANRARRNERDAANLESFRNTIFIPGLNKNN